MPSLIDTNAFLGQWPFSPFSAPAAGELARRLARAGITRALVSPLRAVFLPEPMAANHGLFVATRRVPALVPVPVINPNLPVWREHLEQCRSAAPIVAVRILPTYHGYSLKARCLEPFLEALADSGLKLIVTARLEDERDTYFALRIKGVAVGDLDLFLNRFPDCHVLYTGLYRHEIQALAARHANFSAEISFAEAVDTPSDLVSAIPAARVMFGTCAPLLSVEAQSAKVLGSQLARGDLARIGSSNAREFFSL